MKTLLGSFHIIFAFLCIVLLPEIQAVNPPPDGGYPGGNTAEGQNALLSLTTGSFNTAVGWFSLSAATSGESNTAVGAGALPLNTGNANTATGAAALLSNTIGFANTANGALALIVNSTGGQNTAVGIGALGSNTTGFTNTAVGFSAGNNVTTANHVIAIGNPGADVNNSCFIGQIRGVTTAHADAVPVYIDSAGQLGTISSSRRFKREIKPMDKASEAILALKPVTFHYKSDGTKRPEFGLIAEEVAEVNPDLVVREANGEIYTVRYDAVNAMLLNEFLNEHRKNEEQQATIARQQKQIETLTAGLQKVSAQVEVIKSAPQTALNNP
jgi:trimeric autotransporter adhesin